VDMSTGHRLGPLTQCYQPAFSADAGGERQTSGGDVIHPRVQAVMVAARFHGVELDSSEIRSTAAQEMLSAASLSEWAQSAGMWARPVRLRWRQPA
jgi:subfamily B ATP-binding cassette protein HlyB/CyaB